MATIAELTIIAQNTDFQRRVAFLMMEKALAVATDSPTAGDMALVQKILDGRENAASWALAAVTNATIAAGTHTEDGTSISDGDLRYQIYQQWLAFRI